MIADPSSLLVHVRPLLVASAYRHLNPDEHRHAQDCVQESWIAVWRALPGMPATCATFNAQIAWCMAVARNRMRNYVRDMNRVQHGDRNAIPAPDDLLHQLAEASQAEGVQVAYHHGQIAAALDALPPSYRAYVVERFWHGVPTTELHQRMSPSTWTRTKLRLAEELKELVAS